MNRDQIINLIKTKMEEFNNLFLQVQAFKNHLVRSVYFPEYGICTYVIKMNRLLAARKQELMLLSSKI